MFKDISKTDFSIWNTVYVVLLKRLAIILFILSISRASIYFFNRELFADFLFKEIALAIISGYKFDLSLLLFFSILITVGNSFPFGFRKNKNYQNPINIITLLIFSVAIVFNLSDAIYYRFTLKRMTFDIFHYLNVNGGFMDVAPRFLIDFWYVTLLGALLITLMIYWFYKIKLDPTKEKRGVAFYLWNLVVLAMLTFITVVGIRGGLGKNQYKPLSIIDANKYAPLPLTPIVLNTPFTIMKSYGLEGLQLRNDFTKEELEEIFNPIQSYRPLENSPTKAKNVILIVLEGFSSDHFGYFNSASTFTPFLDSLFELSLVFPATANGKRSIEGIPAILSSIPSLSNESFINGNYTANNIMGLAYTLKKRGYETAFFHGGKNGTMNFDSYTYSAGFDKYFGLNEYSSLEDYDGNWGIQDEPYLQYFAQKLNAFKEPFLASLFTLSSHHPYNIPEEYKKTLPSSELEIQQTIAYTDLSLRKFFKTIEKEDWFDNTLFVITADHTSQGATPVGRNNLGQYSIPIALYSPFDSTLAKRDINLPAQQTDIYPSIINYLGLPDTLLCFGSSVFDKTKRRFAINFNYGQKIQILDSAFFLQIQDDQPLALYRYQTDSLLKNNLIDKEDFRELFTFYKAFMQQYNNRMIENKLVVEMENRN